jgi:hypothetical protein
MKAYLHDKIPGETPSETPHFWFVSTEERALLYATREKAQSDCTIFNREPVQMEDGTQVRDFEVEQSAEKFVIFGLKS